MRPRLLVLVALLAAVSLPARGGGVEESLQQRFTTANRYYLDGDYQAAARQYQALVDAGVSDPNLLYNLANTYYRLGRLGLAVLFYERVLKIDPSDQAARFNLALVRKNLIDKLVGVPGEAVGEPRWQAFVRKFSLDLVTIVFAVLWSLFFILALARRLVASPVNRRLLFWLNVPVLTALLLAGGLFAGRLYVHNHVHHGIVIQPVATLREGPEKRAKELVELHEGLKVRILSRSGDFLRVRLENGVEGYLAENTLGII